MPATCVDSALPAPLASSRYRLVKQIASGGMGAVYVGLQRGAAGFERPVAIKRAHFHVLADTQSRQMILREARHASLVRHPSVISIDDVEEVDGELLLVMNYVEGTSLSHLRTSGVAMSLGVALRIALDVAAALEAIHSATSESGEPLALVHRDISPQNVLVGIDGLARVTDFGIAKSVHDRKQTLGATRRGKLGYMSPEYLRTAITAPSSDLFAFAVVLWEMLAGRRLFESDPEADCHELADARIAVRLEAVVAGVPRALVDLVHKALAHAVDHRFADIHALRVALEDACGSLVGSRDDVAAFVASVAGSSIDEFRRELRPINTTSADLGGPRVACLEPAPLVPSPGLHTGLKGDGLMDLVARCTATLAPPRRPQAFCHEAAVVSLMAARPISWPQAPRRQFSARALMRAAGIVSITIVILWGTAAIASMGLTEDAPSPVAPSSVVPAGPLDR